MSQENEEKEERKEKMVSIFLQLGDVFNTHGSNIKLKKVIGDIKITPIKESLEKTINWYKNNLDFINK